MPSSPIPDLHMSSVSQWKNATTDDPSNGELSPAAALSPPGHGRVTALVRQTWPPRRCRCRPTR